MNRTSKLKGRACLILLIAFAGYAAPGAYAQVGPGPEETYAHEWECNLASTMTKSEYLQSEKLNPTEKEVFWRQLCLERRERAYADGWDDKRGCYPRPGYNSNTKKNDNWTDTCCTTLDRSYINSPDGCSLDDGECDTGVWVCMGGDHGSYRWDDGKDASDMTRGESGPEE
jgi:hypothetical protein